jgi:hypothetical protein
MRRIALAAACSMACCTACAVLLTLLMPAPASALSPAPGLHRGAFHDNSVQLVRRGFRGGGGRVWRGGGGRAHVWRGGRGYAWRGGRVWRGGRYWRGPRWGWAAGTAALAAAPYVYGGYYGRCPLVRRTVWTPRGYRVRWVRRC